MAKVRSTGGLVIFYSYSMLHVAICALNINDKDRHIRALSFCKSLYKVFSNIHFWKEDKSRVARTEFFLHKVLLSQ